MPTTPRRNGTGSPCRLRNCCKGGKARCLWRTRGIRQRSFCGGTVRWSMVRKARLTMPDAYIERGERRDLDVVLERSWCEARWEPLFLRTLDAEAVRLAEVALAGR